MEPESVAFGKVIYIPNRRTALADRFLLGLERHDMSTDTYHLILREFAAAVGGDPAALEADTEVSFEFDGMLAFIFQHPSEDAAVIDVEILQLRDPTTEPANLERLMLLHQLNSVTRFTHGATAFLSVDQMLTLSRSVPLAGLSGQGLADVLSQLLDAAAGLRQSWDDLRALIRQAGEAAESQTGSVAMPMPGQFA